MSQTHTKYGELIPSYLANDGTFKLRNLSVLNYANGFTHWHYRVEEPFSIISVLPTGFFSPASDLIASGDLVTISAPDGLAQGAFQIASAKRGIVDLYILSKVLFNEEPATSEPQS